MNLNDLTKRVTVLEETITRDDEMNTIKTYTARYTVWSNVKLKQSKYASTAVGHRGTRQYTVTMRYDKTLYGVISKLQCDGLTLEPTSVPYNDGNEWIIVDCVETVPVPVGE